MNTFERRSRIVEMVNVSESLLVSEIANQLQVTEVTIRSDLRLLEKQGLVSRFHGGAARVSSLASVGKELSLHDRYQLAEDPKRRIAIAAAKLVREEDTIILDSGSTTKLIAEELVSRSQITVITNSLPVAGILSENPDITLVMCGGTLRHKTRSFHGYIAEFGLKGVAANSMFVGADGLDCKQGITTFNEGYAISAAMAAVSRQVVVVTDASKFGRKGFNPVLPVDKLDVIITDNQAPPQEIAQLRILGKEVILV